MGTSIKNLENLESVGIMGSLATSAGIWQSDYRRVGGRVQGNGDERTNLSSS